MLKQMAAGLPTNSATLRSSSSCSTVLPAPPPQSTGHAARCRNKKKYASAPALVVSFVDTSTNDTQGRAGPSTTATTTQRTGVKPRRARGGGKLFQRAHNRLLARCVPVVRETQVVVRAQVDAWLVLAGGAVVCFSKGGRTTRRRRVKHETCAHHAHSSTYSSEKLLSFVERSMTRVHAAMGGPTMGRFQQSWMRWYRRLADKPPHTAVRKRHSAPAYDLRRPRTGCRSSPNLSTEVRSPASANMGPHTPQSEARNETNDEVNLNVSYSYHRL